MNGTTPRTRGAALTAILNKTYDPFGKVDNVTDMLTDLRHLCDLKGYDFANCDRIAYDHYLVEKAHHSLTKEQNHGPLTKK